MHYRIFRSGALARMTALCGAILLTQACISIPITGLSSDRGRVGLEVVEPAKGFFASDEILLLPLSGLVSEGDLSTGIGGDTGMLVELKDRLDAARRNPRIKAVVLRIDSPGGTVTAADLIHREILKFKHDTHLPVIAMMQDTAASGGIYIAMAADEIYALPTTITGSIGVIAMYPDLSVLLNKVGVSINVIKAGKLKDEGSPWRPMTEDERKVMQNIVDQYNNRFREVIFESRQDKGLTREGLAEVADGRVLTPQQAVDAKLIDGIKYQDEVIQRAKELAKLYDAAVVSYEYPYHYRGNIFADSSAPKPQAGTQGPITFNLFSLQGGALAKEMFGARFLYLWMP